MRKIQSPVVKIISALILAAGLLYGQKQSSFYFNLNAAQEYHSNLYRVPDSLRKDDFRFNSFLRIGFRSSQIQTKQHFNIYYENRLQSYFTYQAYNRMENILAGSISIPFWSKNKLYINNRLRFRSYTKSKSLNYLRNVFTAYTKLNMFESWHIGTGYRHWLKHYPTTASYKDYLSSRLFLTLRYNPDNKTEIGLKTELNWHRGNLYPFDSPKIKGASLEGNRFAAIFSGNKIFAKKYFWDLRYRFEFDSPKDFEVQAFGEYFDDENTEDILAEDSDFDYAKHQFSSSILYKAFPQISFFGFAVIQTKKFQHWRIAENGALRRDFFSYFSLNVKYNFNNDFYTNAYFNFERNISNHSHYRYSREITGLSLRYKF